MGTYLNQAPCLFFSCLRDGTISEVNDTLCTTLEFGRTEILDAKIDTILTIASRIFHQTHLFPLLKMQGFATEIFITLQTKDKKEIPVLINAEQKNINDETVFLYVGIKVPNRKKFEDQLIAAKKAAETAARENTALLQAKLDLQSNMEQLDEKIQTINEQHAELKQFSRVVTHDLQEPLRKLSFFSSMLLNGKEYIDETRIIEKLINVSERMRSIVSGLQQYIWLTEVEPKFTSVDLNELLETVRQQLAIEYPNLTLMIEAERLTTVKADAEQMQLLLKELVSNSIRYRKNDVVHIRIVMNRIMLNKFRNIKEKYDYQEFLKLQLVDNGIGFNPIFKDQVFELFKRLHHSSGQGIGLSLSKKIVENHHGTITIDSKIGEGTTVTVLMPMF
jgi:sigma-B regulation protein RsbU (phosphoserine phosphatase)